VLTVVPVDEIEDLLLTFSERFGHSVQLNTQAPKSNPSMEKNAAGAGNGAEQTYLHADAE
jgi:hypothetical protein